MFVAYCYSRVFTGLGFGRSADNISTFVDEVFAGSLVSTVICHQCHTVRVYVLHVYLYESMFCMHRYVYLCICPVCLYVSMYVLYALYVSEYVS